MSNMRVAVLFANTEDPDLHPLVVELVLGGHGGPHGAQHPLGHLLHRARCADFEAALKPNPLRIKVHHPVDLRKKHYRAQSLKY